MKNPFPRLLLLSVLAIAITTLPSCFVYEEASYRGGGNVYPASRQDHYRDGPGFSSYGRGGSRYYEGASSRYRSGFTRYDSYHDHRGHDHYRPGYQRYDRYDDHYGHDHRNDSKKDDHDDLKHHPNSYRIAGGSTGSKTKPKGYHSASWYKSRGYDINKLTLKNEKGETYKKKKR